MAFEKLSDSIEELKGSIRAYAESNAEYYKLKAFQSGMKGAISLVRILILVVFGSLAVILLSLAVAIAISEALESASLGFFIVGGFYLLTGILLFTVGKKPIQKFMLKKFSAIVFKEDEEEQ